MEIHRARSDWEGNLLVGYLRDNGVEAVLQDPPSVPPLDAAEALTGTGRICGVFVLEHGAERAASLVKEFLSAASDEHLLEEEAARKLRVDRETIARLRAALREEGQTFELLGWISLVFLGSAALLWTVWPAWLKIMPPIPGLRWLLLLLLAVAGGFAGRWAGQKR